MFERGDIIWFWWVDADHRAAKVVKGKVTSRGAFSQDRYDVVGLTEDDKFIQGAMYEVKGDTMSKARDEAIQALAKRLWRESAAMALLSAVVQGAGFTATDEIKITEDDVERMLDSKEMPFDIDVIREAVLVKTDGKIN